MRSIRWKMMLTTMLVVIIPIIYLNTWAVGFFDLFTRTEMEKQLLETGLVVNVPQFVETGETIEVDTRNGSYLTRA